MGALLHVVPAGAGQEVTHATVEPGGLDHAETTPTADCRLIVAAAAPLCIEQGSEPFFRRGQAFEEALAQEESSSRFRVQTWKRGSGPDVGGGLLLVGAPINGARRRYPPLQSP